MAGLLTVAACSDDDSTGGGEEQPQPAEEVNTGLPKVYIKIPHGEEIQSKETWTKNVLVSICDADGAVDYQGVVSMKGRGNMSWTFPKKSYSLKLGKKSEILGMPKHKRWCLISNWLDRTLMRNALGFKISSLMPSLDYTPRGQYVELYVNGTHRGNYYLCEQIKVDEHRVNIAEPDEKAVEGLGVTGGFIFELDAYYDEKFKLMSPVGQFPWELKDPDEVNESAFDYVCRYVADLEESLYDENRFAQRDFAKLMDLDSFVDWWIVHELTMNREPRHPKSCYMYKDRDTKEGVAQLKAGPVWDFDCETFDPTVQNQYVAITTLYYPRLFEDAEFRRLVREHWQQIVQSDLLKEVNDCIDSLHDMLQASDKINSIMWPIGNPANSDIYLSFDDAVTRLKSTFNNKYVWLDYAIKQL